MNTHLFDFLKTQRILVLATVDEKHEAWVSNVYYSIAPTGELFFVSSTDTKHGKHIQQNPKVSFSICWYNSQDYSDRKAVQGIGTCKLINDPVTITKFLTNHYIYYPLWKSAITEEAMRKKIISSRPYVIEPTYIKFWNDELFGEEKAEEYEF